MKYLVTMVLLCSAVFYTNAQSDTTKNLTLKKGADQWSADPSYVQALSVAEVPEAMKQTLKSDSTFQGWQTNRFYFDKQSQLYLMEVKDSVATRLFRFDKKGKQVSGNVPER